MNNGCAMSSTNEEQHLFSPLYSPLYTSGWASSKMTIDERKIRVFLPLSATFGNWWKFIHVRLLVLCF